MESFNMDQINKLIVENPTINPIDFWKCIEKIKPFLCDKKLSDDCTFHRAGRYKMCTNCMKIYVHQNYMKQLDKRSPCEIQ